MLDRLSAIRSFGPKALIGLLAVLALSTAAGGGTTSNTPGATTVSCPNTNTLTGAGSTFINPLFSKWSENYTSVKCGAQVTYQSVGSGAGITQFSNQTVDFGATDSPMTDAQMTAAKGGAAVHIPATIGGVAISYNVPEIAATTHLQLSGDTLAKIFLGTIKNWNDPAIAADNSGVTLPSQAIHVVHRSDGSGTTGILTHYLAAVSDTWKNGPGPATPITSPVGLAPKGNDAVPNQATTT